MFTRFLVPLDGSQLAEAVLPLVARLALACGASVVLLHVIERSAPSTVHGERHLTAADEATTYLQGVQARLQRGNIAVELHTHEAPEGDVARSIVDHASEEGADLTVLCTHGRGHVRDLLFGSIAQQVLRRGATPVLLVKPTQDDASPVLPVPSVRVALDGTAEAEPALLPAQQIARALGVPLELVMVVATPGTVRGDRAPVATLLPATARAALDLACLDADRYLATQADALRASGLQVETRVSRGDIATALAAKEGDAALTVVATHGKAGLQAIWAGSVIALLLARTRGPVLLLRRIDA